MDTYHGCGSIRIGSSFPLHHGSRNHRRISCGLALRVLMASGVLAGCLGQNCILPALTPDGQDLQVLSSTPDHPPSYSDVEPRDPADQTLKRSYVGDKGAWIRRAGAALDSRFPQVESLMWFNMNKERNWRVDSSPGSLAAYRESFANIATGVFLQDYPGHDGGNTSPIDAFEQMVGRRQARIGWYEALTNRFPVAAIEAVQNRGSIPYIVWEPYDSTVPGETPYGTYSRLAEIAGGRYDARILTWARAAAANGRPIEICFGHEMNGDWYAWSFLNAHNGNSAALYARAFRHVVDVFDSAGARNVAWVWTVNASWHDDFSEAFPGAEYVDRIGVNGHNWGGDPAGTDPDWAKWREFESLFGRWNPSDTSGFHNVQALAALADRPIMIGECASAGGDGPAE
ncbi:MAG TPA: glycosyl hydrolase [Phycisphaerae bacterium]|nr:glycosyl hydrolase [Phycisphaerae bacterium]